ncbi:MAG: hypothetical protein A3F33_02445 [Candidatus Woykebacteria bacterium RIFCSPHIGHO2_12_FULL_43_10]|uniref:Uncharacterized protein n=1 Tax=Candidatus Woykebacteria bacterium RIFCSPHIGHO2_02_FULL_43_16b TaxID=1802601 RepID=A0A1G1WQL0_9BACT|nr:MAG: hypothetical protein A2802_00115 [Candidatus Woykebacteria bacterium RIFCSPHIGHO2_01_FULL_43_29]OGY28625.1 MAG: hypothetical protein A3F33_02445 [Candidatus Woykebacteria bacterium RIFCSPHIGHO2_12_FULL_43_10]OGY29974.1 MAG: hypothetical protein A3J50_02735 [Candidatus Woykebacteria bacterium RIFCSPHIGHO2_02_FULL_43_16b]
MPKIIIVIILIAVGIFIFGIVLKGGFGKAPSFLTASKSSQSPCPDPLVLKTPVDIKQVTSILYPGQERGGDFKPHGGFRFDNAKSNSTEVRAPIDSVLTDASRYIEMNEVQYMFDFQTDCGIRYRFDHLLTLAPKFAAIVEKLPEAKVGDSRTTSVDSVNITQNEIIATEIGLKNNLNVFVDFGVYDSSGFKAFQNPNANALCWFNLLSPEDAAKVKSLPSADSQSGSKSTLCK